MRRHPLSRNTHRPARHRHRPCRARRVLIGQMTAIGVLGLAMFLRELPGLVREIRIWRMVGFRSGSRRPR
ncbi:hypothetical protein ACQEU8_06800 [Streptomyces sp. CA-250714]|uniref:hypothetical protein n=1 Tax=Streptomyces sp. CA-250714 TaxID=3240060 RepID=UPI003D8E6F6F